MVRAHKKKVRAQRWSLLTEKECTAKGLKKMIRDGARESVFARV